MTKRISLGGRTSEPNQQLRRLHALVEKTAADAGLDQRLLELVKIRSSMLNGCAFCLDMHTRNARKLGETEQRIYLLGAWRETDLYSEQERAALALTDAMTLLPETRDIPDRVYEQAVSVFTEDQYRAVASTITVINAFTGWAWPAGGGCHANRSEGQGQIPHIRSRHTGRHAKAGVRSFRPAAGRSAVVGGCHRA